VQRAQGGAASVWVAVSSQSDGLMGGDTWGEETG